MRRYVLLLLVLAAYFLVSPMVAGIGPPGVAVTGLFVLVLLAVTGQIFLAVIVATLVGSRLTRSTVERQTVERQTVERQTVERQTVAGEPERRPAS